MFKVNEAFVAYMVSQLSNCRINILPTPFPLYSQPFLYLEVNYVLKND